MEIEEEVEAVVKAIEGIEGIEEIEEEVLVSVATDAGVEKDHKQLEIPRKGEMCDYSCRNPCQWKYKDSEKRLFQQKISKKVK